jgi:hypothetical protein
VILEWWQYLLLALTLTLTLALTLALTLRLAWQAFGK